MIGLHAVIFAVQVAVALAGAARYPAGLDPALCPNYPHCNNALLAAYAPQPAAAANDHYTNDHYTNDNDHYTNAGQYYGPGYQNHPAAAGVSYGHHLQPALYTEPGYPAGLTSSNCPNYPYCSHQVPTEAFRYAHKRYPSGATPENCPNYPYCH